MAEASTGHPSQGDAIQPLWRLSDIQLDRRHTKKVWFSAALQCLKVAHSDERSGYGSRLLQRSVAGQLEGIIGYDWSPAGVTVNRTMKDAKLAS